MNLILKIGDSLPDYDILDQTGKTVNLSKLQKETGKILVIFFYPKDNTPGCTKEACNFRDNYNVFQEKNILIFGVSKDSEESHIKFINKFNLPFPLLTDPELKLTKLFGAYGQKRTGKMGLIRSTFVTDEEGKIKHIFGLSGHPKVNTSVHGEDVLQLLSN